MLSTLVETGKYSGCWHQVYEMVNGRRSAPITVGRASRPPGVIVRSPAMIAVVIVLLAACGPAAPTSNDRSPTPVPQTMDSYAFSGHGGFEETFRLPSGPYVIAYTASFDPTYDYSSYCSFDGDFHDVTAGWSVAVGGVGRVYPNAPLPLKSSDVSLSGTYRLTIFNTTSCDWTFDVEPNKG